MSTELKPKPKFKSQPREIPTDAAARVDQIAKDIHLEADRLSQEQRLPRPAGVNVGSGVKWEILIPIIVFHLLIPLAFIPYFFSIWGLLFLPIGNFIFTSMGIGAGYHRLLTHRGFECPKWFEYTLAILGVCSFQESPARWVLVHRVHHQHSDHQPDPHTPRVSAFWAHMGWLFIDNRELSTVAAYDRYCRDLMRDPFYFWLQRGFNSALIYMLHGLVLLALGIGLSFLFAGTTAGRVQFSVQFFFWTVIMRTIYTWHVTWAINSATHIWGYQNYDTREDSTNHWLFALLTNGEGWHNNHHADPRSAQHGHRWWEFDWTYRTLSLLEKVGIVKNLVRPNYKRLDLKAIEPK